MDSPRIIDLPVVTDPRGNLSFIQGGGPLPFEIQRCYWIYDVPGGKVRHGRALKRTTELIVALSGSFDAVIDGVAYHLCRGYQGLLVPPNHWRELVNFSTNAVALVLADTLYDEADYIRQQEISEKSEASEPASPVPGACAQ
ncbi:MAG: FdtA/QdtA family cupin domain-containing protein, partial [Muribaculaceae bacterium]|nr:FdtA/QdtA family cupin domain-containing protein [Muribaculaceae bacterium]